MKKEEIGERSEELLGLVGLSDEAHRIRGFSRGMKQRLGIAQALLSRPKLLVCDEPTSALDPVGRKEILDTLMSVREQTTVIFSTHILSDVEKICTSVALLHDGKIAMQGSVDELKKVRRAESFTVETVDGFGAELIKGTFAGARLMENYVIGFSSGEDELFAVMEFIKDKRIAVRRIEVPEPTLESLFLEVVGS
jgi:ABC-2 type transport system ATP-binding protein